MSRRLYDLGLCTFIVNSLVSPLIDVNVFVCEYICLSKMQLNYFQSNCILSKIVPEIFKHVDFFTTSHKHLVLQNLHFTIFLAIF